MATPHNRTGMPGYSASCCSNAACACTLPCSAAPTQRRPRPLRHIRSRPATPPDSSYRSDRSICCCRPIQGNDRRPVCFRREWPRINHGVTRDSFAHVPFFVDCDIPLVDVGRVKVRSILDAARSVQRNEGGSRSPKKIAAVALLGRLRWHSLQHRSLQHLVYRSVCSRLVPRFHEVILRLSYPTTDPRMFLDVV
jgi:hypothetical protein